MHENTLIAVITSKQKGDQEVTQVGLGVLFQALKREGVTVWKSWDGIKPGELWKQVITTTLQKADLVLVILSNNLLGEDEFYDQWQPLLQQRSNETVVFIQLQSTMWDTEGYLCIPSKPITQLNKVNAWLAISGTLRQLIADISKQKEEFMSDPNLLAKMREHAAQQEAEAQEQRLIRQQAQQAAALTEAVSRAEHNLLASGTALKAEVYEIDRHNGDLAEHVMRDGGFDPIEYLQLLYRANPSSMMDLLAGNALALVQQLQSRGLVCVLKFTTNTEGRLVRYAKIWAGAPEVM